MASHTDNVSLFSTPAYDSTVRSVEWVQYRPVGQLNSDGALEFNVSGNSTKYIDLKNTRLKIKFRILQGNGNIVPPMRSKEKKPIPDASKVGPVNLFLQTMWRQVDVTIQQQLVSPNISTNYPYKAYLETLLNYGWGAKDTQIDSQIYRKDTGSSDQADPAEGSNMGLLTRSTLTEGSKFVDIEGPVHVDICQQNRYILNGVQVNFKLWPSSNQFKLMSSNPTADYKLDIQEAVLKVCMIELSPDVLIAHAETLKHGPAKYFYDRTDVRSYAIAKGQYSCCLEDVYQGEVPNQVIIGFVASDAFMGTYRKSPFRFQTYNCNFIGFYVDGKSLPTEPLTPNYKTGNYLSAFMTLFGDKYQRDFGNDITRRDYVHGYCLYVFDICQNACERFTSRTMKGHTRLEVKFAQPLPEAVTLIAYANFPGLMEIDETRNVNIMERRQLTNV